IAWIDSSGAQPRLMTAPTDRDTPVSVTTLNPTAHINEVSLSSDGGAIAYTVSGASGPAQLVVAQLPSGAPLAVAPDAHAAVFGAGAASISFIADVDGTATLESATLPGASSGPHVVHVSTTRIDGALVLQLTFDSDLDQSTLSGAISVTSAGGAALTATTHYDAATRTAVVTLAAPVAGALHIDVSTSLRDIDEQPSAKAFDTTISL